MWGRELHPNAREGLPARTAYGFSPPDQSRGIDFTVGGSKECKEVSATSARRSGKSKSHAREFQMTHREHRKRHIQLYRAFGELVADYLDHQPLISEGGKSLEDTTLSKVSQWAYSQTKNPTKPLRMGKVHGEKVET